MTTSTCKSLGALAAALLLPLAVAIVASAQSSNDSPDMTAGPNAPEMRDAPGMERHDHEIVIHRERERTQSADGTRTRNESRTTLNTQTGVMTERVRTRVRNPDGSETRTRTRVRTDEDGTVISERTRTREKPARADRDERSNRPERADRPRSNAIHGSAAPTLVGFSPTIASRSPRARVPR